MGTGRAAGRYGLNVLKHLKQGLKDTSDGGMCLQTIDKVRHCGYATDCAPGLSSIFLGGLRSQGRSLDLCTTFVFGYSRTILGKSCQREFKSGIYGGPNVPSTGWRLANAARISKRRSAVEQRRGIGFSRPVTTSVGTGSRISIWTRLNESFRGLYFYGKCYFELSKARLSFFVVSTAAVGFVMGSGDRVDLAGLAWTSVGTMLAASSANAFNQILEVANDAQMKRTMRRPLPAGRISKNHALVFAVTAGVAGVTLLASQTNDLAAQLGAANVLLYTLVYTPLKQIHYVNTWVGAVVGAIPPLLGWAAASGQVDKGGWVLASALYFWQIPHFMALAFLCREDYAKGGYKMLSLLDASGRRTASCALRSCVYLLPLGFLAQQCGTTTGFFGVENLVLTVGIGAMSAIFYLRPSRESARRVFLTSLMYLPAVMTAMVVHRIPNPNVNPQGYYSADAVRVGELYRPSRMVSDGRTVDSEQGGMVKQNESSKDLPQPPISFLSFAPFPFLPAPDYS